MYATFVCNQVHHRYHHILLHAVVSDEEKARYTSCTYDLVSSIVHEGGLTEEEGGVYKTYSYNKLLKEWFEFEDVRVEKVEGASLSRTAAHVQIWVRRGRLKTAEGMQPPCAATCLPNSIQHRAS